MADSGFTRPPVGGVSFCGGSIFCDDRRCAEETPFEAPAYARPAHSAVPLGVAQPAAAAAPAAARGGDGEWGEGGGHRYHLPPPPSPAQRAAALAAEVLAAAEGAPAPPPLGGRPSAALAAALGMASVDARVPWAARLHRVGPPPAFLSAPVNGGGGDGGGGGGGGGGGDPAAAALRDFLPEEDGGAVEDEEDEAGGAEQAGKAALGASGLRVFGGGAGEAEREDGASAEGAAGEERGPPARRAAEFLAPRGWLPLAPPLPLCTCGRTLTARVPGFERTPPGAPLPCLAHGGRL
jgi:hypothetical protein